MNAKVYEFGQGLTLDKMTQLPTQPILHALILPKQNIAFQHLPGPDLPR